jgi:hypothetical protein
VLGVEPRFALGGANTIIEGLRPLRMEKRAKKEDKKTTIKKA